MKKLQENLNIVIAIVAILILFKTCSTDRLVKREIIPTVNATIENVEEINNRVISTKEMELLLEKAGYEISYRMLYDNNAVVRTTVRPDDIMKQYTDSIDLKRRQLRVIHLEKNIR